MRPMNKKVVFILLFIISVLASGCASTDSQSKTRAVEKGADGQYGDLIVRLGVQGSGGLFGKARRKGGLRRSLASWVSRWSGQSFRADRR